MTKEGPRVTDLDYLTVEQFAAALLDLNPVYPGTTPTEVAIVYREKASGVAIKGVRRVGRPHPYSIIVKESSLEVLEREAKRYGV